jgi:hypothetical protein
MRSGFLAGCLALGLTALAAKADAANAVGTISQIEIIGTQYAILRISGGATGTRPACHTGGLQQSAFAMDLGTAKGRAMLSFATAAHLAGRSIEIGGAGTCLNIGSPFSTVEQVQRLTSNQ